MAEKRVLFVCTGNVCRSPMAEYLLRHRLRASDGWGVSSAGIAAFPGMTASPAAVEVLRERRIDLTPHRSRTLGRELVSAAALVIVMTGGHRQQVCAAYPGVGEKVFLMRSFDADAGNADVEDPIGASSGVYRGVRREIESALPGLLSFMGSLEI